MKKNLILFLVLITSSFLMASGKGAPASRRDISPNLKYGVFRPSRRSRSCSAPHRENQLPDHLKYGIPDGRIPRRQRSKSCSDLSRARPSEHISEAQEADSSPEEVIEPAISPQAAPSLGERSRGYGTMEPVQVVSVDARADSPSIHSSRARSDAASNAGSAVSLEMVDMVNPAFQARSLVPNNDARRDSDAHLLQQPSDADQNSDISEPEPTFGQRFRRALFTRRTVCEAFLGVAAIGVGIGIGYSLNGLSDHDAQPVHTFTPEPTPTYIDYTKNVVATCCILTKQAFRAGYGQNMSDYPSCSDPGLLELKCHP